MKEVKKEAGRKRKAVDDIDYGSLKVFFGPHVNNINLQNPESHQDKKTLNKECEPLTSSPSNSMAPRGDKSPSCLTAVTKNLEL